MGTVFREPEFFAPMRPLLKALTAAGLLFAADAARAAEPALIGLSAPLGETMALLGEQVLDGATLAAHTAGVELLAQDDQCSAEGGKAAAEAFVESGALVVVGFLCTEAIEAALPILARAGIPTITPGVRADRLTDRRDKTGFLLWRLAPRADDEVRAVTAILSRLWRENLFAIVDDGTVYGRELAEGFRLGVEMAGLRPVFVDTYRPQSDNQVGLVGRLRRAGATHVFVGGDRDDIAIIARDAAAVDLELTIAGGEALRAASERELAAGTLMIAPPEWSDMIDEGVAEQFSQGAVLPEGYALPAYAAVEVAHQALEAAREAENTLPAALSAGSFATILGPVAFDAKGDLKESPFRLFRYDGERFLPIE